jgi:hypothetical protein
MRRVCNPRQINYDKEKTLPAPAVAGKAFRLRWGSYCDEKADRMADRRFQPSPDYGGEKQQHVAALLPFVLPAKSLTINTCCRVADFLDQCVNLAPLAPYCGNLFFCPRFCLSLIRWLYLYSF